jgi:putative hydrolase of the HAD superfamily
MDRQRSGSKHDLLISRYRAVVFDLFHTLTSADTVHLPGKSTSEILGVSRTLWNEQLINSSEDRLKGRIIDPYLIIGKLARAIDPDISEQLIKKAADARTIRFRHSLLHIEPAVLNTLDRLKKTGKLLGLVSNGDQQEVSGWASSPLNVYFDAVIFSCHAGFVKPEKQIYELCIKKLGVMSGECLFVGDGGSDELAGAKAFGMRTVMTTRIIKKIWPEKIDERRPQADFIIDELDELLEIIDM